jgi:protein ImuA
LSLKLSTEKDAIRTDKLGVMLQPSPILLSPYASARRHSSAALVEDGVSLATVA